MSTQAHSAAVMKLESDAEEINAKSDFMSKLPTILRLLGAAALLVAMYSFLIKGWQGGNDVFRYLLLLGHTGVLASIGLASGHFLKESKGARLLLTLALVSIPANFAILGAFIFSQWGIVNLAQYPEFVAWTVTSMQTATITSVGALAVLIPVTLLGFTVLARSMSTRLSVLYLLSNAALLLPMRDPILVGLLVLGLAVFSILVTRTTSKKIASKTKEGLIALSLQSLPLAVLMGRTLWLYSLDLFLFTAMVITVFVMLRQASIFLNKNSSLRQALDLLSLFPAIFTGPLLAATFLDAGMLNDTLALALASVTSAFMVYEIARRNEEYAFVYRFIAAFVLLLGMCANVFLFTGTLSALLATVTGLAMFMLGLRNRQRGFFISGLILMVIGIVQQFYELIHHFNLGSWATLAVIGVLAIVTGSIIEAKGGNIHQRITGWKSDFKEWEG